MNHKEEKPLPGCKAILLCERTMIEAGTNKISLIGLIGTIAFESFPGRTKPMKLFLHLVDGIGQYDVSVEVHDLAEDNIVFRSKTARLSFSDRLLSRRPIFSIPGLPVPHAGKYDVIVFADGKEIDRQQVTAIGAGSGEKQ